MTAVYDESGVQFLYPENWRVGDEETVDWPRGVTLQSPGSGFWSLMIYPTGTDPSELTDQAVAAMHEEYDDLEAIPHQEVFDETEMVGFDMYFYCLDMMVNARAMSLKMPHRTLLVLWQAEDREFEKLEPIFRAITTSLLRDSENDE